MTNYPDGMTRADLIHVGEIEPDFEGETRVLRAVIYLTYEPHGAQSEDEMIDAVQSPYQAEKDIARILERGLRLEYQPDSIEVVDAQYMSEAEANA